MRELALQKRLGHPRLRIPVGKGYAERSIPLHQQAAEALQPLIGLARQQRGRRRYDASAGREVQHIFVVRGKLFGAFPFWWTKVQAAIWLMYLYPRLVVSRMQPRQAAQGAAFAARAVRAYEPRDYRVARVFVDGEFIAVIRRLRSGVRARSRV